MAKPIKHERGRKSLFAGPIALPDLCDPHEAQRRMALALVLGEYVRVPMFMHEAVIHQAVVMLREKLVMRENDWKQLAKAAHINTGEKQ